MSINRTSKPVSDIIDRAVSDAAFRDLLYTDPAAALSGYSLTAGEQAALSDRATVADLIRQAGG
jgi:hypothetical protein